MVGQNWIGDWYWIESKLHAQRREAVLGEIWTEQCGAPKR